LENNESGKVKKLIERDALIILESYSGANNYILYLQDKQSNNPRFLPTRSQSDYIVKYSETIPKIGRRWVDMDPYFSKKIADENGMIEIPKRVWVEKLLVEKEKSYHVWAKYNEKDKLKDMWMPKGALLKTHTIEEVDIDYTKYSHRPPLNHQLEAIEKLVGSKRFILADDMGLGKTTATIIAALETGVKKILIICPASLKLNWQREIENYTDRSIYIAEGKKFSTEHDFVIVNYDILKNFYDIKDKENSLITKSGFDVIILDEAHYVSNGQAKRTKLVNSFCKNPKYLWLLTGTPMTNRPINYFNLLNLIESPVSQNWMAYAIRYCQGYQFTAGNRKIWNVSGASNLEELRDRTSRQVLRRLKTEVLDLPDKIISPVYMRLKSKMYEALMGEYYEWYDRNQEERKSLTVQFSKLMKVRQIIADEKVKNTIELAENILEQGKKVIIFTNFTNSLNKITEHFKKKAVKLDGSSTKPSRQKAVDDFQEKDKIQVFVGNTKAAGVGITLTAGEAVIFNDISFVPGDMEQAEDRAYRYGQKNSVSIYYPLFENTIESVIYDMVNFKKQNIQTVMGDNLDTGDFVEVLMNKINNLR
jgi:SWI/SNF-related matrix-associated actin-dependent regulator of chromatin subfamily A-like protein 1